MKTTERTGGGAEAVRSATRESATVPLAERPRRTESVLAPGEAREVEAVGRLAANIGHEFSDILTVVLSNVEAVVEGLGPGRHDLSADLEDMRRAARRGADRVAELMSLSGRTMLRGEPVDLADLLREARHTLDEFLPSNISLQVITPEGDDCGIFADPGAMHQILLELAANAREAMSDGGELIMRVLRRVPGPGARPRVLLQVTDSGIGMDAETRTRVFDPFFTTAGDGRSDGLGLSITRGLVTGQGGRISVDSRLGEGTSIELEFPAVERPAEAKEDAAAPAAPASPDLRPVRDEVAARPEGSVLVVEDDSVTRRSIRRALERNGLGVVCAEDGDEALNLITRLRTGIAAVVVDLAVPGLRGAEIYEVSRAAGLRCRFVFTSGCPNDGTIQRFQSDPAVTFMRKPWAATELLSRFNPRNPSPDPLPSFPG